MVIIACNVQSTVTSHILRNVASILRAKSQVILAAKIVSNPYVWRNAACKVENYASCNAMCNTAGKVASDDTCLRRILRARLQILLPVKLDAILRARLQVMSLVIRLAILYIRLNVIIRIKLRARRHARLQVVLAYSVILYTRLRAK